MPFVSVVVPSYNQAAFLQVCLSGLQGQSDPDWECVVVDDGSTDNSPEIAARFASQDPRFRCLRQANAGVSVARNAGLQAARGEWIAFLDADDFYFRGAVASFSGWAAILADHPGAPRFISGGLITSFQEPPPSSQGATGNVQDLFFRSMHFTARGRSPLLQNSIFHRSLLEITGGFDPGLRTSEDRDFLIRAAATSPVAMFPGLVAFYRTHHGVGKSDRYLASGEKTRAHRRIFQRLPLSEAFARRSCPDEVARFNRLQRAYLVMLEAVDRTREGDLGAAALHLRKMDRDLADEDERRALIARFGFFFRHPTSRPRLAVHNCLRTLAALRGIVAGQAGLARLLEGQIRKEAARLSPMPGRQTLAYDYTVQAGNPGGVPIGEVRCFRAAVRFRSTLSDGRALILGSAGRPLAMDRDLADALRACGCFRTIDQHAQVAIGRGVLPLERRAAFEAALEALRDRGALQALPALQQRLPRPATERPDPSVSVSQLVLRAATTAAGALATLDSYLDNAREHGRHPQVLVLDGLGDVRERRSLLEGIQQRQRTGDIELRHAGPRERARYLERLIREAEVDPELEGVMATRGDGGLSGAWMNAVLLDTSETTFLNIAEGSRCAAAHVEDPQDVLLFTGHPMPERTIAFSGLDALQAELQDRSVDLIGAHEHNLGQTCRTLAARHRQVDVAADAGWLLGPPGIEELRVATTVGALYGELGGDPRYLLLERESLDPCLLADRNSYDRLLAGTGIWRGVTELTVGRSPFLHSLATGFWNAPGVLPPFPPNLAGGDKVFGCVLAAVNERALVAHLPIGVEYRRPLGASADSDDQARGTSSFAALGAVDPDSLLLAGILSYQRPLWTDGSAVLVGLGQHLGALADLSVDDLQAALRPTLLGWIAGELGALDRLQMLYDNQPDHWATAVEDYRRALRASLADGPPRALLTRLRRTLRGYGGLLRHWPRLTEAAVRLRARGLGLSVAVDGLAAERWSA